MKKKIKVFFVLLSITFTMQAQMLTLDLPHILETIHNGYLTYQSVMSLQQQLTYAYESAQNQLKQLQELDWNNIQSFEQGMSYVDQSLSFIRETENKFKSVSVDVGGTRIPLNELYKTPMTAYEMVKTNLTSNLSNWDKAMIYQRYGLTPANYMYLKAWENRIEDATKSIAVIKETQDKRMEEREKAVNDIVKNAIDSHADLATQQAILAVLQHLVGSTNEGNRLQALAISQQDYINRNQTIDSEEMAFTKLSNDWLEVTSKRIYSKDDYLYPNNWHKLY